MRIVFAGDPRALALGLLGPGCGRRGAPAGGGTAQPFGAGLEFLPATAARRGSSASQPCSSARTIAASFGPVSKGGGTPGDPTLYVCAEDRGAGSTPPALERFEIIENCRAGGGGATEEAATCRTARIPDPLGEGGSRSTPGAGPRRPERRRRGSRALFPGSAGSLYGLSPHGPMAALKRPRARTAVPGLLTSRGAETHPGAGRADGDGLFSGRHAAETIRSDRISTSRVPPDGSCLGGMSTGSPTTGTRARSPGHRLHRVGCSRPGYRWSGR